MDLAKLSLFARKVFYHPTLIRTAGPEPGRWGVWSDADLVSLPLGRTKTAPRGARFQFRLTEKEAVTTLLRKGGFSIRILTQNAASQLKVANGKESVEFPLGTPSRDRWLTLEVGFADGKVTAVLDGTAFKPAGSDTLPSPRNGGTWYTAIGKNPVYDVELLP